MEELGFFYWHGCIDMESICSDTDGLIAVCLVMFLVSLGGAFEFVLLAFHFVAVLLYLFFISP